MKCDMKNCMILWCLFACWLAGCEGEDEWDQIDILKHEAAEIRTFLDERVKGEITRIPCYSKKGLLIDTLYIFHNDMSGNRVGERGIVLMDYTLQTLDGRVLDSTDPDLQLDSTCLTTYALGGPVYHVLDTSRKFDYLGKAFQCISEGETGGEMLVPSKLGAQDGISHHYMLKVHRVIPDIFVYEKELIGNYIQHIQGKIGEPMLDEKGDTVVYTVVTKRGSGDHLIQEGDRINLSHKSAILDEVHLEQGVLRLVQMWDSVSMQHSLTGGNALGAYMQALTHLREGDEAEIIIPFSMAYDRTNMVDTRTKQIIIPAFTTLIYRVTVNKVEPAPEPEEPGSDEES